MLYPYKYFEFVVIFMMIALLVSCGKNDNETLASTIISMEQTALDRWGKGDPSGFLEICAEEVTYFDTGTEKRVDGLKGLEKLYAPRKGKIHIDGYKMINPKVQISDDTAVLTFNLIDYVPTNEGKTREIYWNSTEVYKKIRNEWKIIHTHWSKPKV